MCLPEGLLRSNHSVIGVAIRIIGSVRQFKELVFLYPRDRSIKEFIGLVFDCSAIPGWLEVNSFPSAFDEFLVV